MGPCDPDHAVAKFQHQKLEIVGNQQLVLNDEDVGGDLLGHLTSSGLDERSDLGHR